MSVMSAFSWMLLHLARGGHLGPDGACVEQLQRGDLWGLLLMSSLGIGLVASVAWYHWRQLGAWLGLLGAWRCFSSSATHTWLLPGYGGSGVAGLLPLGRHGVRCWSSGVPGVDHLGYVMLRASWGPRCVATLLQYSSRLDLFTPSTIT